ncbi:MAG: hypothetical protein ACJ8AI_34515 [Rhodopila sp.]
MRHMVHRSETADDPHARRIVRAFTFLTISTLFGQNIGWGGISISLFLVWGTLLWLFAYGNAVIDVARAFCFGMMLYAILLGLFLTGHVHSLPAMLLFFSAYAPLLLVVDTDQRTFAQAFRVYLGCMTVFAWIVIIQQVMQYTVGSALWPNLHKLLPQSMLVQGYFYERAYSWRSPYLMPNGIFFLEPSGLSGALSTACAAEFLWFKRWRRLVPLGVALLVGMAGTGVAVAALVSPFLLWQADRRLRRWAAGLVVPLLVISAGSGLLDHYFARQDEFSRSNSSAHARFVTPFEETKRLLGDPGYFLTGDGPGVAPRSAAWPITKLSYDYGVLAAVLFQVFLAVACLAAPPSRIVALTVLIPKLFFGGGFIDIASLVICCSLLRVHSSPPRRLTSRDAPVPAVHGPVVCQHVLQNEEHAS